jgi:hypothetical protein
MNPKILSVVGGCLLLPLTPLWAQAQTTTAASTATATTSSSSFNNLSAGNQKIADALFAAQKPSGTQTALTKDQIANLKGSEGWGRVFKQMKSDGLVTAKNLGQVVSAREHSLHSTSHGGTTAASSSRHGGTMSTGSTRFGGSHVAARGMSGSRFSGGHFSSGRPMAMSGGQFGHGGMGGGFGGGGFGGGGFGGGHGGGHGR